MDKLLGKHNLLNLDEITCYKNATHQNNWKV